MTRERHIAILRSVRKNCERKGITGDAVEEKQVDRILEELDLEDEEKTTTPVVEFPIQPRPDLDILKPPPAAAPAAPMASIVVAPPLGPPQPVASSEEYWDIANLAKFIEANTPAVLSVFVAGKNEPFGLSRSVETPMNLSLVKLTYGLAGSAQPVASLQDPSIKYGEATPMERMAIDLSFSQMFTPFDRVPPIEAKLQLIRDAASHALNKRDTPVVSRTVPANNFSIRPEDVNDPTPHESV